MFFLLPFRAKNPPEGPVVMTYVTMVIIGLASIVFDPYTIVDTAWSLLFIWLFGSAVEGRLGPVKFSILVVLAAAFGWLADLAIEHQFHQLAFHGYLIMAVTCAVLGLEAGYVFMFPYAMFSVWYAYWFFFIWWGWGVWEVQARWLVLLYLAINYLFWLAISGVIGALAPSRELLTVVLTILVPLLGFGFGLFVTWLMRPARDTEAFATAQATRVDFQDIQPMPLGDLEELMKRPAGNVDLIMSYLTRLYGELGEQARPRLATVISANWDDLLARASSAHLAKYVLLIPMDHRVPAPNQLLRLAHKLEADREFATAIGVYQRIYQSDPRGPCTETALMRMAALYEKSFNDTAQAAAVLGELISTFPEGTFVFDAREQLRRLEQGH